MRRKISITTKIISLIIALAIFLTLIVGWISIRQIKSEGDIEITNFAHESMQRKKAHLHDLVNALSGFLAQYNERAANGEFSLDEAKRRAASRMSTMRYYGGAGYYWVHTCSPENPHDPILIMDPTQPEMVGKSLRDSTSFIAMNEVCLNNDQGFIPYSSPKPTESGVTAEYYPKLAYVKIFKPWGWVVGSGVYLDDFEKEKAAKYARVQSRVKKAVLTTIAVLIITFLVVTGLGYYISRKIVRPIRDTSKAALLISDGHYDTHVDVSSSDEIGEMAKAFNVMADELERRNSELKARESALKESKERYRSVVENVQEGLCIVDTEEVLQFVNPAFSKLLGVDADKIVGISLEGFVDKETFARFQKGTRDRLKGVEDRYEITFRRPDGKLRDVDLHATPLYSADGNYYGTLGLAVDITERKRLEGHLVQVQKMEAIGTLAGGIAHDFNNILGGILGYVSLLKMSLEPGSKERRYIDQVEKAGNRAAELTGQLLAFSRKGKYEVGPVNVLQLIEKILTLFSRTIDKSIKVTTSLQEDLMIEGDRHQLEQAIMGICINAVQALEERGEKREEGWTPILAIETKEAELNQAFCQKHLGAKPGKYVLVSVTDTGTGIDKETLERIFEPFFTTKEVGEGTGLGLSMVYGIVKSHGGYIDVYSELGHGTTLSVYLPIMAKKEKEEKSKEKLEEQVIAGSETILVVDDEDVVREAMKEMLESVGYKVLAAINGKEAVELYQSILDNNEKVDLVILDMNMPVMGGREAFHQMKHLNPNVRVLLATGLGRSADAHAMLDSGVTGFFYKPFSMSELSKKVREVLEGGRDERI